MGAKLPHLYLELWRICTGGQVAPSIPLQATQPSALPLDLGNRLNMSIHMVELRKDQNVWRWISTYESLVEDNDRHVYLAWYKKQVYKLKWEKNSYPLLHWVRCATCGKWVKSTTPRGQEHLRGCHRCPTCQRTYTTVDDHECVPREPRVFSFGTRRTLKMAEARCDTPIDWSNRPEIGIFDFETFPNPSKQGCFMPYAVGFATLGIHSEAGVYYGREALPTWMGHLWDVDMDMVWYGWNSSAFDLMFVIAHLLEQYHYALGEKAFIKKGKRIMSLEFENSRGKKITFKDAYLLVPQNLAAAGKAFGVPDKWAKSDFDHTKVYSWATAEQHKLELVAYLKADVECTRHVLRTFGAIVYERYHMDTSKYITISHLAAAMWSIKCRQYLAHVQVPSIEEHQIIYQMVRGGRVQPQVKQLTSEDPLETPYDSLKDFHRMLDCNSLYPQSMTGLFMTGHWTIVSSGLEHRHEDFGLDHNPEEPEGWPRGLFYNYFRVLVKCPKNIYTPFLPSRDRNGALEYTLLDKDGEWYTGEELLHAVHYLHYKVKRVYDEWKWSNPIEMAVPLFNDFIQGEYENRQRYPSGTAQNEVSKLAMNSVYGKMGQKPITSENSIIMVDDVETAADFESKGGKLEALYNQHGHQLAWLATLEKLKQKVRSLYFPHG